MRYSGVIFDFNGTLFWDTKLHNKAWNTFLNQHDLYFSDEEFFRLIHGRNNKDILRTLFGATIGDDDIARFVEEKENMYQELCLKTDMQMAPGAIAFFDFLKSNQIPFTIATASGKENLDFYFDHLPLSQWFDYDKVVYNNGKIQGKPDPEIYQIAMSVIGRNAEDVIIFEDAIAGLEAAKNAQAGKIIVVNSNGDNYDDWANCQVITHFDQVSRSQFKI